MKGSILKRGPRRYLIRLFLGRDSVTGKASRPGKTVHGTRKEAESLLRQWVIDLESGRLVRHEKTSLNEYLDEWKTVSLQESVGPKTFAAYCYDLDRFVTESIGRLPLTKVQRQDVQQLYIDLVAKGVGPTSVLRLHACLSRAFRPAVDWHKVTINPVAGLKVPGLKSKVSRRPPKPMDPEQANAFLDAASQTDWRALFEVAISSGMRPGEYLGLGWDQVDFKENLVRVVRSAKFPANGEPHIGLPKMGKSRSIDLHPMVMESLREHKTNQAREILSAGSKWNRANNLVFPGANGEIWREQSFRKAFGKVCQIAGLKGFTAYSLRHTCATLLLLAKENTKVVSERLGHSTVSMTLDTYSHVLPTMQKGASDKLAEILKVGR